MINFCTITDKNYILKGLTLRESLNETMQSDFVIHWLCIDIETFATLHSLEYDNIYLYKLSDLENKDLKLQDAKNNPPSQFGTQYENYCWAVTPYFINYILTTKLEENEKLAYVDSDLYFYRSPERAFREIGTKSIGIHTHNFREPYAEDKVVGWYNVGLTVFTKDKIGIEISENWKNWLLDTTNEFYMTHGTCGDQKYLELFVRFWKEHVCIFDQNTTCSHLAPWYNHDLVFLPDRKIQYGDKVEDVLFFHFSHFVFKPEDRSYSDSINGEWAPTNNPAIKEYYNDYFEQMNKIYKEITC